MLKRRHVKASFGLVLLGLVLALTCFSCKDAVVNPVEPVDQGPVFSASFYNETQNGNTEVEFNDTVTFTVKGNVGVGNQGAHFNKFEASFGPIVIGTLQEYSSDQVVQGTIQAGANGMSGTTQNIEVDYVITLNNGTTTSGTRVIASQYIEAEKVFRWDDTYGAGHCYNRVKNDPEGFARIVGNGDFTDDNGHVMTYTGVLNGNKILTDGNPDNGELKYMWLDDTAQTCAGVLYVAKNDGTMAIFIDTEKSVWDLRQYFAN